MNINKIVDKKYEKMSFNEIADSPFSAIQGVTESESELISQAFHIKELSKYVNWARAIVTLAEAEEAEVEEKEKKTPRASRKPRTK